MRRQAPARSLTASSSCVFAVMGGESASCVSDRGFYGATNVTGGLITANDAGCVQGAWQPAGVRPWVAGNFAWTGLVSARSLFTFRCALATRLRDRLLLHGLPCLAHAGLQGRAFPRQLALVSHRHTLGFRAGNGCFHCCVTLLGQTSLVPASPLFSPAASTRTSA